LRIEVQNEQAMISHFIGVQDDASAVGVGCYPVRFLLIVQRDSRNFANVGEIGDVIDGERVD